MQPLLCFCWGTSPLRVMVNFTVQLYSLQFSYSFHKNVIVASGNPNNTCILTRQQKISHFSMKSLILIISLMQTFLINAATLLPCIGSTPSSGGMCLWLHCFCYYHRIFTFLCAAQLEQASWDKSV